MRLSGLDPTGEAEEGGDPLSPLIGCALATPQDSSTPSIPLTLQAGSEDQHSLMEELIEAYPVTGPFL